MRILLRACFALLIPALLLAAEPAPPGVPAPQTRRQPTLKDVDAALPAMQRLAATLPAAVGRPGPDHTGRTVEQDLAEYVFAEAALQRMAQLRAELQSKLPEGAEDVPLPALAPLLDAHGTELCRINLLGSYWLISGRRDYHRGLVRSLAQSAPAAERQTDLEAAQAIDLRAEAMRDKAAGLSSNECNTPRMRDWLRYEADAVILDYNALRTQIVEREAAAGRLPTVSSMTARTAPCPPADTASPRGPSVKIRSAPDMRPFYPEVTRNNGVEGVVRVTIDTDASGCVIAAGLERTSGSELLDQAGIRVAFEMLLIPREVDGKSTGSRDILPLRFQLPGLGGDVEPANASRN